MADERSDSQGLAAGAPEGADETAPANEYAAEQPFLERLSDGLQHIIGAVVGSSRKPPRLLKSLLNGVWLGHPLHPLITDVPIAAWVLTAVLDIIWLIAPATNNWAARGAEVTAIVGFVAALGAAVTGATDWSDTYGGERRVGLLHGLFMLATTVVYAISIGVRLAVGSGESVTGAILGFAGVLVLTYAAYLGGDLVFTFGTGVNHTAWEPASEEFEPAIALSNVAENKLYRVSVAGVPVVLLRAGETLHAIAATCPHAGGPLDEGTLERGVVQCPWHGSRFRMRDGKVLTGPATVNAPRYEVRVRDGQVELRRVGGH